MEKSIKSILFVALLSVIISNCAFKGSTKKTLQAQQSLTANISMPINATLPEKERIHLAIDIPHGYKCLQDNLNNAMLEFVPATDLDAYTWSEIITTMVYGGKRIQAKQFVTSIKNYVLQIDPTAKVLEEIFAEETGYTSAQLKIKYKFNNRIEIMHAHYFSGPYDCSGFQYSIALSNKMNESAIIKKINTFVKNNTHKVIF